ncbi:hypothetical protein K402DRAFT_417601 [Aulographum hederae CBS 113979]|uniref:Uncharacterized protein n=1 Tax=Aulographum hederae CBS 113979 TaxID=1176131 RepID=A0A6G1HCS5_9PEZI|nr:hypothetical protein K402DRAFT_417601 [Aulographum hederae CBS 113979]
MQVFGATTAQPGVLDHQHSYLTSALQRNRQLDTRLTERLTDIEFVLKLEPSPLIKRKQLKQARWKTNKALQICRKEQQTLLEGLTLCQARMATQQIAWAPPQDAFFGPVLLTPPAESQKLASIQPSYTFSPTASPNGPLSPFEPAFSAGSMDGMTRVYANYKRSPSDLWLAQFGTAMPLSPMSPLSPMVANHFYSPYESQMNSPALQSPVVFTFPFGSLTSPTLEDFCPSLRADAPPFTPTTIDERFEDDELISPGTVPKAAMSVSEHPPAQAEPGTSTRTAIDVITQWLNNASLEKAKKHRRGQRSDSAIQVGPLDEVENPKWRKRQSMPIMSG